MKRCRVFNIKLALSGSVLCVFLEIMLQACHLLSPSRSENPASNPTKSATRLVDTSNSFVDLRYLNDVELESSNNIDYSYLKLLLQSQQWQQADQETRQRLLEATNRQEAGWLRIQDIQQLSCTDLKTIAQLWHRASSGRFGLIVQAHLRESLGGKPGQYQKAMAEQLGNLVGWRQNNQWKSPTALTFDLTKAPPGHLPTTTGSGISGSIWEGAASVSSRLENCQILKYTDYKVKDGQWSNQDRRPWWIVTLLANRRWWSADKISLHMLQQKTKRENQSLIPGELPCPELKMIDKLYNRYSNGKFGFSIQQKIYLETGNQPGQWTPDTYEKFKETVGWMREQTDDPPPGFFPFLLGHIPDGSSFHWQWRARLNPQCVWSSREQ